MRHLIRTIALFILLLSCCTSFAQSKELLLQYTGNEQYIKQKVAQMLTAPQKSEDFWYADDSRLEERDPNAYLLLRQMITMGNLVNSADDAWAWVIAMDECIEQYNARLGRKIGSPKLAVLAIEELIEILCKGNQAAINSASGIHLTLSHYKTINAYYDFLYYIMKYSVEDRRMQILYYKEFKAWYNMYSAARDIMGGYTYGGAIYTMAPMEFNETVSTWVDARAKDMALERTHYDTWNWTAFKYGDKEVSAEAFGELLNIFKSITMDDIIKSFMDSTGISLEYAKDFCTKERFNIQEIAESALRYEQSLIQWRSIREQIAEALPQEMRESYRETTKHMHTRLYNELLEVKQIKF